MPIRCPPPPSRLGPTVGQRYRRAPIFVFNRDQYSRLDVPTINNKIIEETTFYRYNIRRQLSVIP